MEPIQTVRSTMPGVMVQGSSQDLCYMHIPITVSNLTVKFWHKIYV